ncbi:MAG: toxin-antitoxin system HicB family antitoxin [Pseudomonadales bacterium]|nr:toxin-antitoxin system HicB family antitoxin [Pseudomonadales bacterium]
MKPVDKYLKLVEWSEEDQCYIGSSPGFLGPCCHGRNETMVYKKLCQIIDEWITIYQQDNKPLPEPFTKSDKFALRVDQDLHKALAIKAAQAGESMDTYCAKHLRKAISNPGDL